MTDLIRLERPREPIRYPDDVAVLRKALNERGYDASDEDIAWAYSEWCEEWCCGDWISVDGKPLLLRHRRNDRTAHARHPAHTPSPLPAVSDEVARRI